MYAVATKDTGGFGNWHLFKGRDMRLKTAVGAMDGKCPLRIFTAGLDTSLAHDAFAIVAQVKRVVVIEWNVAALDSFAVAVWICPVFDHVSQDFGRLAQIYGTV